MNHSPSLSLITLRIAKSEDATWLLPLAKRIFCDTFEAYYRPDHFWGYVDRAYTEDNWRKELSDPQAQFVVAWVGDQPVGYIKLNWNPNAFPPELPTINVLEVGRIYLDASQHGSGIGQQLMDHAFAVARDQNRQGIWLSVWQRNSRALSFYRRNGFKVIGLHPFEMGAGLIEDDFLMYCSLASMTGQEE